MIVVTIIVSRFQPGVDYTPRVLKHIYCRVEIRKTWKYLSLIALYNNYDPQHIMRVCLSSTASFRSNDLYLFCVLRNQQIMREISCNRQLKYKSMTIWLQLSKHQNVLTARFHSHTLVIASLAVGSNIQIKIVCVSKRTGNVRGSLGKL